MEENCQDCQPEDSAEIPEYQCTKKVRALEIEKVVPQHNGSLDLFFGGVFAPMNIEIEFLSGKPTPQAGWFYVQYKGGYFSFSPRQEFIEGYHLIK